MTPRAQKVSTRDDVAEDDDSVRWTPGSDGVGCMHRHGRNGTGKIPMIALPHATALPNEKDLFQLGAASLMHCSRWERWWLASDYRLLAVGGGWMVVCFLLMAWSVSWSNPVKPDLEPIAWLLMAVSLPGQMMFAFGAVGNGDAGRKRLGADRWVTGHASNLPLLARAALAEPSDCPGEIRVAAARYLDKHHPQWLRHLCWSETAVS